MGEFISALRKNGRLRKIVILAALGILLLAFSIPRSEKSDVSGETLDQYKARLESEVASLCSSVDGVGKCRVFITFERGEQNSYKGSVLTESKPPRVLGVSVVCRGADSDHVRSELTDMLTSLFGIGSNRVAVLKLN